MCDGKDFDGAFRCLSDATTHGLDLPETWLLQGVCHIYRGTPAEGLPFLERAVGYFTTWDARLALTDAYLQLGMKQQARESLKILDAMLEGADRSKLLEPRMKQLSSLP
jgi:hypothetical protein